MAACLTRINSLTHPHTHSSHSYSVVDDMACTDDLFVGLEDVDSMSPAEIFTSTMLSDQLDVLIWSNHAANIEELPFLAPSPNYSSSAPHELVDDDQMLDMPWDDHYNSRSSSLWPVHQWSPPSCSTYSTPESCSFTALSSCSSLHSDMSQQYSDITEQSSLSSAVNADDQLAPNSLSWSSTLSSAVNADDQLAPNSLSWSSTSTTDQAYHYTAMASHDAFPLCDPQRQNPVARMPSTCSNDIIAMAEEVDVATSSSQGLVHVFNIECENLAIEDGYTWRKYGEKNITGRAHKRAYFRCAYNGCTVKKQAERSSEKEGFLLITYFGKHNHHPTHQ